MFKSAKAGDRVWSIDKGWGTVKDIFASKKYPLTVTFKNDFICAYTLDGKNHVDDLNPTLFWNEIKFEVPSKPKQKCKFWVVFCYDGKGDIFVHGDDGFPVLFKDFNKALEVGTRIRVAYISQIEVEI